MYLLSCIAWPERRGLVLLAAAPFTAALPALIAATTSPPSAAAVTTAVAASAAGLASVSRFGGSTLRAIRGPLAGVRGAVLVAAAVAAHARAVVTNPVGFTVVALVAGAFTELAVERLRRTALAVERLLRTARAGERPGRNRWPAAAAAGAVAGGMVVAMNSAGMRSPAEVGAVGSCFLAALPAWIFWRGRRDHDMRTLDATDVGVLSLEAATIVVAMALYANWGVRFSGRAAPLEPVVGPVATSGLAAVGYIGALRRAAC